MKITLIPSATGAVSEPRYQYLTSYLINDSVAIDAGSIGLYGTPEQQVRIKHILLTHSHIDHIASLPILLENAYDEGADCVTVHGSQDVLDCLQTHIFNDLIWPDFIALSRPEAPFLRLRTLVPGKTVDLDGLRVTPVPVNHVVPSLGFIIDDGQASVVFSSDTGPTDEIWRVANAAANLKAVFLEVTFPNSLGWLATVAKHHTPATFAEDLRKLKRPTAVVAVHIKSRFYDQVVAELQSLGLANLDIGRLGTTYQY